MNECVGFHLWLSHPSKMACHHQELTFIICGFKEQKSSRVSFPDGYTLRKQWYYGRRKIITTVC